MKLISVDDLSLQNEGYFAFKHVAFSLSQNEIIGINGENGSGKTLILDTLAERQTPDSGVIDYTPGVRIGCLPQTNPQVIERSVGKYLEDVRRLSGKLAVRKEQLSGMITLLGISPYLDQSVQQLSTGLKRRIEFLAAVAGHPNVLLLDEPFAFQSHKTIHNMLDLIQDLKENGSGIILASTCFDEETSKYLDNDYLLKNNRLEKIQSTTNQELISLLVFSVHSNSLALTHDLSQYVTTSYDNTVEMEVPLALKATIMKRMLAFNYQFEGARNDQD